MPRNRRKFTREFKAQVVLELLSGVKQAAEVCREYQIKPQLFNEWKSYVLKHASRVFDNNHRLSEEQARIIELERVLGRICPKFS